MPQGKDYIFALQDKNFNFWKVENGVVSRSAQPYFLSFSPDGWSDISIQNVRNKKYWGIDRTVTIPLKYVNDGAQILKYIFYTLGIEESVYLVIASQKLDFDIVKGAINISELLPDVNNSCEITGEPGETVYLKLTPTTSDVVDVFIDPGDDMYHQFGQLSGGKPSIFPLTIPESGSFSFILYFSGSSVNVGMSTKHGNSIPEYGFWYKRIFRGEVDLSTFAHNGSKITATTLDDGLAKYLKANEGTVFEFPMNVPEAIKVKMDGINLHESLNYQATSNFEITQNFYGPEFLMPVSYLNNEGDSVGILSSSQTIQYIGGLPWEDKWKLDNFLLKNVGTNVVNVNISGTVEFTCTKMISQPAYAIRFRFIRSNQAPANQNDYQIFSTPGMIVGQTYSTDFSITIPLAVDEKLFFEAIFFIGVGTDAGITFSENNKYKITFITRQDTTYIRAFRPQYLFEQLLNKVTEGNFIAAISNFFTKYKNVVLTSGNAIRGLEDATLKIKWTDFFKWWDSFSSVGLNEKLKVVDLDEKENLIDTVNTIKLPEPASDSFKVSVAKDLLFNELQIGYPEMKNDVGVLNGNEETNTKMIFSLGTTKSPAVLDKISPVKASPYEIEKIRVTTLSKDTTDYKADNDTFVLEIEDELQHATDTIHEHYKLDRSLNSGATGILEPATIFNIGLSPKRNLLRNGSTIRSFLYLLDGKTLKFISADKNDKMVANGLLEKADVNIGSLGAKFLNPILFDFDIEAPEDLEDMLDINPLQLFEFPFQGDTYFGLLEKVSVAPSSNAAQSYQLLSHASNDLTKLIQYYGQ